MADTKQRLIDGALTAIRTHGIAGTSARTIAAAAGVNQALVFYHFGSVAELVEAALPDSSADLASRDVPQPSSTTVTSFTDLLTLGRELHAGPSATAGNVAQM